MKRILKLTVAIILALSICGFAACDDGETPNGNNGTVTSVVILGTGISNGKMTKQMASGVTFTLAANVNATGDAELTVTWDSSDKTVATVNGGSVTMHKAGSTNITATSTADTTKSAKVELTVVDNRNLAPTFPDGPNVKPLEYEGLSFSISDVMAVGAEINVDIDNDVVKTTYNAEAAKSNWSNYVRFTLPQGDYSRATQFGLNICATPSATIYLKLANASGQNIWEGDISATTTWSKQTKNFTDLGRADLAGLKEMYIYVPRPQTSTKGGEVSISRVWLDGDKEPAVVPQFVFNADNIVATVPITPGASGNITTSGDVSGTNGKLNATFADGGISIVNTGYNDWKNILLNMPKDEPYGEEACWMVFDITDITGNALIKFYIMGESIRELYPIEGTRYYASYYFNSELQKFYEDYVNGSFYMQIAPSYLNTGAEGATFTINGIHIMKQGT